VDTDQEGRAQHWDRTYQTKTTDEVSWFQREPTMSLRLLTAAGLGSGTSLIDVGGGASTLVDAALRLGVTDVTVLDIAQAAMTASRSRLGDLAHEVTWLAEDVLTWVPARRYDLWHDRAVFHFLTEPADHDRYREVLRAGLAAGGSVVIGTFAEDGPQSCSGLPVARYSPAALAEQFPGFDVVDVQREEHHTPWDAVQPFTWLLLREGSRS
jgi:hypothetical protein